MQLYTTGQIVVMMKEFLQHRDLDLGSSFVICLSSGGQCAQVWDKVKAQSVESHCSTGLLAVNSF
jgi:hypothetical protein